MGKKTDPTFILNADNTVTSDMCIAKKHDGARCTHRSVLTAPAMVQGSAAYSPTRIPSLRDFFRAFEIPLCKQHYNCLVSSRFGIDVINFITPETDIVNNNVQEDTMDTTYTTNHMFPGISLDALISRAADMWSDQAEYVRDFYRCEDPTEDYPKWFKDYTNRIRRLNLVIDNRQFIEFWMKNPIFPNVPKEDIMNQPIIPTRLCCGQKHLGDVCPDGTIMCGICFGKFTAEQWDNECGCCKECAIKEKDFEFRLTNGMCTCIVNANGEISSPHYTCTHHQDLYDQYIANGHQMPITSKEDNMNTNKTIPTYGPEMDDINAPFVTAGEIRINNERIENNFPQSWPELEGDLTKHPGYAKCSNCSKEIGEDWFHPVHLIRTCMGAAPASSNRRGSFVKNEESGVVTNEKTGDQFVFDTSKQHVFNVKNQLKAQGLRINAVGFSKKTSQWYVCWTPES